MHGAKNVEIRNVYCTLLICTILGGVTQTLLEARRVFCRPPLVPSLLYLRNNNARCMNFCKIHSNPVITIWINATPRQYH